MSAVAKLDRELLTGDVISRIEAALAADRKSLDADDDESGDSNAAKQAFTGGEDAGLASIGGVDSFHSLRCRLVTTKAQDSSRPISRQVKGCEIDGKSDRRAPGQSLQLFNHTGSGALLTIEC
ncbi:MAG TPA: hypothetical protein VEN30_13765 [Paraburkholderia sp.]|nr:hypothetical protein [Paraburkholderia sp.]